MANAMSNTVNVLPPGLLAEPEFRVDASNLLSLSPGHIATLRAIVGTEDVSSETVSRVAKELGLDDPTALRYAYTLRFLVNQLILGGDVEAMLRELEGVAGISLDEERNRALTGALRPMPEELADTQARRAFAFGDTFISAGANAIYAYGSDNQLYPGLNLTVSYRDATSEKLSISFNASVVEVKEFIEMLTGAVELAERRLPGRVEPEQ